MPNVERSALDAWGMHHIPFDGPIDIDYLIDIPNADIARKALAFLMDDVNRIDLSKRHTPAEMQRMHRGVFRGCLAHGVTLTANQKQYARMCGVIIPT